MKKFLVIQTASIGDVILATAVLEKLHQHYPDATIDFLIKKGNDELFINHPYIKNLLVWNKGNRKYINFFWILNDIRKNKYDVVINIQRFASTGFLTALSGAPMRIGFAKNPFSIFFNSRIRHKIKEGIHETDRNQRLIEKLTDATPAKPRLYPDEGAIQRIQNYARSEFYTISPGSLWFTKQFPKVKWIEFVSQIDKMKQLIFIGSKAEHALCEEIIWESSHRNSLNVAGHLTLHESAALMQKAKMNFTNDSSPMHLASAMNAPVTAIYCSTIPGFGFAPLSGESYIVEHPEKLYCRPCSLHGKRRCPEKHFKCALEIPVNLLLNRL